MEAVANKVALDVYFCLVGNDGRYMCRAKQGTDDPEENFNLSEYSIKSMAKKLSHFILSGKVHQIDFKLGSLFANESGMISYAAPTPEELQDYDESLSDLEIKLLVKNRIGQILEII